MPVLNMVMFVHSVGQKSIGLKFSKSQTRCDVRYSCHHNSSPPDRSRTVQNKQPPTCSSWLVVACKVTFSSRLHNNACLSILTLHAYGKQQQPSSLLLFRFAQIYSRVLQLAAPKNALHVFLSLCTKIVSNYRVVK